MSPASTTTIAAPKLRGWARAEYRRLSAAPDMPAATHSDIVVDRDLGVPAADGVSLLTDHWRPAAGALGSTILVRTPYGRRGGSATARFFAERGHHVVVQSCRGTFGSGTGDFAPFHAEAADGRATLTWVRAQPWATGPVHTWGASYVGFTQWAVSDGPNPPDAMTIGLSARRFQETIMRPGGGISLETMLVWSYSLWLQEQPRLPRLINFLRAKRRIARAAMVLPIERADVAAIGQTYPPFHDWLAHGDIGDPWWERVSFASDPHTVPPATLIAGWQDLFLAGGFQDYAALRDAGRPVRLIAGDWTHHSPESSVAAVREALQRLDGAAPEPARVRIEVGGGGGWRELPDWPPPSSARTWSLTAAGGLVDGDPGALAAFEYTFDPADPTPQAGGRSLNPFISGRRDQRPRETRADVLVFTSDPLDDDLTVVGDILARLALTSSNPGFDVFLRVCDVDPDGTSHSVSDAYRRAPEVSEGLLDLEFPPVAHRFAAGHRIRLQVSSGAHPLHLRNFGAADPVPSSKVLVASQQMLRVGSGTPSGLVLPVSE